MTTDTLVGTGEIEKKHGLTRLQVFRLIAAEDWPEPIQFLERGRVWYESDIDARVEALREAGRITKDNRIVPWRYLDREAAAGTF
jgi:predicted DNA-binding transcriptional regulator AlpA